jgi:hypothetical protein
LKREGEGKGERTGRKEREREREREREGERQGKRGTRVCRALAWERKEEFPIFSFLGLASLSDSLTSPLLFLLLPVLLLGYRRERETETVRERQRQ